MELPATTMPVASARWRRNHWDGRATWRLASGHAHVARTVRTHDERKHEGVRYALHDTLRNVSHDPLVKAKQARTIVRKNCHTSVQNALATMLTTQMIAPAARNGWRGVDKERSRLSAIRMFASEEEPQNAAPCSRCAAFSALQEKRGHGVVYVLSVRELACDDPAEGHDLQR